MISFLLQEGVITIGTISGIFTALLLNSLKNNIIDPVVEKIASTDSLLGNYVNDLKDDGLINNSYKKDKTPVQAPPQQQQSQQNTHGNQFGGKGKDQIKWKIFMRDFVTWLVLMTILYFIWKYLLNPIKMKNGLNIPTTNTQFIPMNGGAIAGMGKFVKK